MELEKLEEELEEWAHLCQSLGDYMRAVVTESGYTIISKV